jgi:HK97 family phage major capsid protein
MPNVGPSSTPIAFGDFSKAYTVLERKAPTMQIDPYTAGFCRIFKFEARVGGATTCPNAIRLLRVR